MSFDHKANGHSIAEATYLTNYSSNINEISTRLTKSFPNDFSDVQVKIANVNTDPESLASGVLSDKPLEIGSNFDWYNEIERVDSSDSFMTAESLPFEYDSAHSFASTDYGHVSEISNECDSSDKVNQQYRIKIIKIDNMAENKDAFKEQSLF